MENTGGAPKAPENDPLCVFLLLNGPTFLPLSGWRSKWNSLLFNTIEQVATLGAAAFGLECCT